MASITIRIDLEKALIKAKVPRDNWADFVNTAALEKLNKGAESEEKR